MKIVVDKKEAQEIREISPGIILAERFYCKKEEIREIYAASERVLMYFNSETHINDLLK